MSPRLAIIASVCAAGIAFAGSARADVAVTFDDGPQSNYDIARPELLRDHIPATFYIISGQLGPRYGHVTADEVRQMSLDGFEIGSHTVDHPDLTTLDPFAVAWELTESRATLEAIVGRPVVDFAYPGGKHNPAVDAACIAVYETCRGFGGDAGVNTLPLLDRAAVKIRAVDADTTVAQVRAWIDEGRAPGLLVVLVYHNLANPTPNPYAHKPRQFKREMRYLARSGAVLSAMDGES